VASKAVPNQNKLLLLELLLWTLMLVLPVLLPGGLHSMHKLSCNSAGPDFAAAQLSGLQRALQGHDMCPRQTESVWPELHLPTSAWCTAAAVDGGCAAGAEVHADDRELTAGLIMLLSVRNVMNVGVDTPLGLQSKASPFSRRVQ